MKRDKIIQIISHPEIEEVDKETGEKQIKNYILGLTEMGAIYEWSASEWHFVTLSPEDE